ncbi:hypothetical protein [Desulfoluna butyratoxydans]|uniref:hypothetical protein n=1 Tax=Desulfoluna butyratoxydans TaxID=231438 RepID=UPI0015D0E56D|nr:hypothetical protein [Desulfoluna butyratoxydans]
MNQKNTDIQKIWRGLKNLIFSISLIIVTIALLFYLYNASDFRGFDLERAMFEHQDAVVFAIAVFGAEFVLLLLSIYRVAKSLDKNAAAWLIACVAFPMVLYVAIIYLSILGVYNIIKIKFTKNVEPSPSSSVRSPLG